MTFKARFKEGWAEYTDLPGFENYVIKFKPRIVHGKARATSLRLDEIDPDADIGLTAQRLASLPLQSLVNVAVKSTDFSLQPDLQDDLRRIAEADDSGYTDPRSVVSPKQVAEVWLRAYYKGEAPRRAVTETLGIHERTADNKINQAVEAGLIPAEYRRSHRTAKPRTKGTKKKKETD